MQIIKAYDQTYCIKKTSNLQICCVLFKHVYYVIDVTKKLQVSPVNKRYLAIDIFMPWSRLIKKINPASHCRRVWHQNKAKCILRYVYYVIFLKVHILASPLSTSKLFFTRLPFTTRVSSMIWRSKFGKNPTYFIILYKLHSCSKYILVYYVIVFTLFKFVLACLGLPGRPFKLPFENAFAG